jgi:hypothetical protein
MDEYIYSSARYYSNKKGLLYYRDYNFGLDALKNALL